MWQLFEQSGEGLTANHHAASRKRRVRIRGQCVGLISHQGTKRALQRLRLEPQPGETLSLDMSDLCVLGLRNDADGRALAVRLGEGLRTIAITSDTRLYAGLTLAAGHEILTPLRPTPMAELTINVETAWDDALDAETPEAFQILLTQTLN